MFLKNINEYRIILASASPRRRELLGLLGLSFEIEPAKGEEIIHSTAPADVVRELSAQKAYEIAGNYALQNNKTKELSQQSQKYLIIGSDTVVSYDGVILGKPKDEEDAVLMLQQLQNRTHSVFTGVTVYVVEDGEIGQLFSIAEETEVTMYPVSEDEIRAYVATKDSMDKAGAYAIQGQSAVFIQEIKGDYNNVVGLPVARLYQELKKTIQDTHTGIHKGL